MEKIEARVYFETAVYQVIRDAENGLDAEDFIRMMERLAEEFYDMVDIKKDNWSR
jgi:hypothetical protein